MNSIADANGWRETVDMFFLDLQQAILNPASNPTLAALSVLIVLVFLAALAVLGAYVYMLLTGKRKRVSWVRVPATRGERWTYRALFVVSLIAIALPATYYTQSDRSCLNCHTLGLEKSSLEQTEHRELACIACHMNPGVSGYVQQKVDFGRWTYVYLTSDEIPPSEALNGKIVNASCLKCHRAVLESTLDVYNLRVSHKEIHEASSRCIDCHNQVAHPGVSTPERVPRMPTCLQCHDGSTAPSECAVCHTRDVGEGARPTEKESPRTRRFDVAWNWCYECHSESNACLPCHGVTMPHPPGWADRNEVAHAPAAAFTRKQVCWRCHFSDRGPFTRGNEFCETCHQIQVHGSDSQTYWSHQRYRAAECTGACHRAEVCTANCHTLREPSGLPAPMRDYPFTIPSLR